MPTSTDKISLLAHEKSLYKQFYLLDFISSPSPLTLTSLPELPLPVPARTIGFVRVPDSYSYKSKRLYNYIDLPIHIIYSYSEGEIQVNFSFPWALLSSGKEDS